jgi:hypothetical protein
MFQTPDKTMPHLPGDVHTNVEPILMLFLQVIWSSSLRYTPPATQRINCRSDVLGPLLPHATWRTTSNSEGLPPPPPPNDPASLCRCCFVKKCSQQSGGLSKFKSRQHHKRVGNLCNLEPMLAKLWSVITITSLQVFCQYGTLFKRPAV